MVLVPSFNPAQTPAAIAMTFFSAAPSSTPTGSSLVYSRSEGPANAPWISRASSASADAITTAAGSPRAISRAKVGPERAATRGGNLRPTTSATIPVMRSRVVFSIPLVALTKRIEGGQ